MFTLLKKETDSLKRVAELPELDIYYIEGYIRKWIEIWDENASNEKIKGELQMFLSKIQEAIADESETK